MSVHRNTFRCLLAFACSVCALLAGPTLARAADRPNSKQATPGGDVRAQWKKVYGEWRILIKPDKGPEYNALIKSEGLPIFRQAGGRMVGWWTTLVGNLYEQITIWEYDDMAAFEKAVGFLGRDKRFAAFVARRDPLLAGESNRFLKLVPRGEPAVLADPSKVIIHEIHRVPPAKLSNYLSFISERGLKILKKHRFRPAGPFVVDVGDWSEVTYVFRFDSLEERSRLIADFSAHPDSESYEEGIHKFVDRVSTRVLVPAPFVGPPPVKNFREAAASPLLPHVERLADGVFAAGFADRYHSANCGWVRLAKETLLIDLPHGVGVPEFLSEVDRLSGAPVRKLALTNLQPGDEPIIAKLVDGGVKQIITSSSIGEILKAGWKGAAPPPIQSVLSESEIGDAAMPVDCFAVDHVMARAGLGVHLRQPRILFAGALVVNGPRTRLSGSDTESWIEWLERLEKMAPSHVVPAFGSWGDASLLSRERRFLSELRRQVSYVVSQGRPESSLKTEVHIPADDLVWMPYDTPTLEDLQHVYRELTVPNAPFNGYLPEAGDRTPHALVLIGDTPHEPGHIIEGLTPVFRATDVIPHFSVDVRALTAENLAKVRLLVILRDGQQRPTDDPASNYAWMTSAQQDAVVRFVTEGGAFLNLHNSMGLYPDGGPYLKLVGGRYIGHGPLERFNVEVVDAHHPITRGVEDFWVADEQHTPPYDAGKVHLLLRNRSDDGKVVAAAGWAYEPGRGRLCHLANGHTRESLLHPMYQRLMQNAVNWCLRRDFH